MILKPTNQVMSYGKLALARPVTLVSLDVCILTVSNKYKVLYLERKNSKCTNMDWGITVLAAALKRGLEATTQHQNKSN